MKTTKFTKSRLNFHREMADAYWRFLRFAFVQNKKDKKLQDAMAEASIKFLSSYFIAHAPIAPIFEGIKDQGKRSLAHRRYLVGDYYSREALTTLRSAQKTDAQLRFEHVIPKNALRKSCEAASLDGKLPSVEEIATMLDQSWHIAIVLKTQDDMLRPRNSMPADWKPGDDVFARYRANGQMHFELLRVHEERSLCARIYAHGA